MLYVYICYNYKGFHKWGYPNSWMVYNGKSTMSTLRVARTWLVMR